MKSRKTYQGLPIYISPFFLTIRPGFYGFQIVYMSLRGEGMIYDSDYSVQARTFDSAINKMKRLLKKENIIK